MTKAVWRQVAGTGIFVPFIATTWLVSGLISNMAQLLARVVMLPFPRSWFVVVNSCIFSQWASQTVWLVDWWGGTRFRFFAKDGFDPHQQKENAIVCGNHYGEVDWMMGYMSAHRMGQLSGCKSYIKDSAKYLPVLGWSFWLTDYIFLARNWAEDKKTFDKAFDNLRSYPASVPWFIACFCEGTRQTPAKIAESQKWCEENGKPKLKHVLWPRTKGFAASCVSLEGKLDAVWSISMAATDEAAKPSFLNMLLAQEPVIQLCYKRWDAKDIPKDEEGLKEFCCQMYIEKDADLEECFTKGQFPGKEFDHPPKVTPAIFFALWSLLIQGSAAYLAYTSPTWRIALGAVYGLLTLGLGGAIAFGTQKKGGKKKKSE